MPALSTRCTETDRQPVGLALPPPQLLVTAGLGLSSEGHPTGGAHGPGLTYRAVGGEDFDFGAVFCFQIQEDPSLCRDKPFVSAVTMELSKETLDTMLDGLGRIRDQLSAVASK